MKRLTDLSAIYPASHRFKQGSAIARHEEVRDWSGRAIQKSNVGVGVY